MAAAVVLIVAAAFVLLREDDEGGLVTVDEPTPGELEDPAPADVPAAPESVTALATAEAFTRARDAWDGDTAAALFAPDAVIADMTALTPQEYPAFADWHRVNDWRWTTESCTETAAGPPTSVTCTYTHENAWSRAMGLEPFPGSFQFEIADGQILNLENGYFDDWVPVFVTWSDWLLANHRFDFAVMYEIAPDGMRPLFTPEALALYEPLVAEFATWCGNEPSCDEGIS